MRVIDNFVQDDHILEAVMHEGVWQTLPQQTRWYSGWWKQRATNIWHDLIYKIWKDVPRITEAKGFEYWGNTLGEGFERGLGVHKDKDEILRDRTGEIVTPTLGAVYYPYPSMFEGGYLEIFNDDDFDKKERLAPVFNRLVVFNPSHYHRVTPVYHGYRRAFVVNVWMDHLPEVAKIHEEITPDTTGHSGRV
jgi:hypothetical protein